MPRMAVVGDLDLDETLGALLDPIGEDSTIPPAADPTRRWLRLAELDPAGEGRRCAEGQGAAAPRGGTGDGHGPAAGRGNRARGADGAARAGPARRFGRPMAGRHPPVRPRAGPLAGGTGGTRRSRCRCPAQPAVQGGCAQVEGEPARDADRRGGCNQRGSSTGAAAQGDRRTAARRGGAARSRPVDEGCGVGRTRHVPARPTVRRSSAAMRSPIRNTTSSCCSTAWGSTAGKCRHGTAPDSVPGRPPAAMRFPNLFLPPEASKAWVALAGRAAPPRRCADR